MFHSLNVPFPAIKQINCNFRNSGIYTHTRILKICNLLVSQKRAPEQPGTNRIPSLFKSNDLRFSNIFSVPDFKGNFSLLCVIFMCQFYVATPQYLSLEISLVFLLMSSEFLGLVLYLYYLSEICHIPHTFLCITV